MQLLARGNPPQRSNSFAPSSSMRFAVMKGSCSLRVVGKINTNVAGTVQASLDLNHLVEIFKETLKQASQMSSPVFNDRGQLVLAPHKPDGVDATGGKKDDAKTAAAGQSVAATAVDAAGKNLKKSD